MGKRIREIGNIMGSSLRSSTSRTIPFPLDAYDGAGGLANNREGSCACGSDVVCLWTPSDYHKIRVPIFGLAADCFRHVSARKKDPAFYSRSLPNSTDLVALHLAEPLIRRVRLFS